MQNSGQELEMAFTEVDGITVLDNDVRSCTKGLSGALEKRAQELSVPNENRDRLAKSKEKICFEVVFSCNGYDYLGP